MTTFTATPETTTGTIRLDIYKTDSITELIRSDVNGTRPVRIREGEIPSAGAGTITITDHEPAFIGDVVYSLDGEEVVCRFSPAPRPRFTLPFHPEISTAVDVITTFEASRDAAGTEHEILGRADPIIVSAPMRSRRGTLRAGFDAYEKALELEDLLKLGQTVMFRQGENFGQDFYFYPKSTAISAVDGMGWELTAGFTELRPPAGSRAPAGWTFDSLASQTGETFKTILTDYESFNTLSIGQDQ